MAKFKEIYCKSCCEYTIHEKKGTAKSASDIAEDVFLTVATAGVYALIGETEKNKVWKCSKCGRLTIE